MQYKNHFGVSLLYILHSVHVDSVNLFSNRQKSILTRVDKQASKFNLKSDVPFEEINGEKKYYLKKRREEKNEDISLECKHFGVGNENTNLVIYDMAKPKGPTNGANSDGTNRRGAN